MVRRFRRRSGDVRILSRNLLGQMPNRTCKFAVKSSDLTVRLFSFHVLASFDAFEQVWQENGDRSGTSSRVLVHPVDVRYLPRCDKIVKKLSAFRNASNTNRFEQSVLPCIGIIWPKDISEDKCLGRLYNLTEYRYRVISSLELI